MSEKKGKELQKSVAQESPVAETPSGEPEQTQATEVQETILETDFAKNAESVETSKPETAKEQAKEIVGEFARKLAVKCKEQSEFIAPYAKAYPGERAFHITSDKQVFLERDRGLAVLHQNSLGNEERVQTIKIK